MVSFYERLLFLQLTLGPYSVNKHNNDSNNNNKKTLKITILVESSFQGNQVVCYPRVSFGIKEFEMSWVKVWTYEKYVKVTQLRASGSLRHTLNRTSSTLPKTKYQYLQSKIIWVFQILGFQPSVSPLYSLNNTTS